MNEGKGIFDNSNAVFNLQNPLDKVYHILFMLKIHCVELFTLNQQHYEFANY